MSKTISKEDKSQEQTLSKWDNAISDAKRGIARLQRAIETFEERKAAGEPWPADYGPSTQN
jgi:hypothetical protein